VKWWPVTPEFELHVGDALEVMRRFDDEQVNCIVTSPPYFKLRNSEKHGRLGWENTVDLYAEHLAIIFSEARRVLRKDGVLWVNVGETFSKKRILGVPHAVRMALQDDGWIWRSEVIWNKTNVRPESAKQRVTHAHEFLFMFTRSDTYWTNFAAIDEPAKWERWGDQTTPKYEGTDTATGWMKPRSKAELSSRTTRKKRSVWSIPTANYRGAHDAVYPEALVEPCILATCPEGGVVLDPFFGAGTTALVALRLGRRVIGIELKEASADQARVRVLNDLARRGVLHGTADQG
jgi:site-specific DNA-methyltransferase (adenine-specific)